MDLTGVTDVVAGTGPGPDGLPGWQPGDAWLAGGTWLFSEPQPGVRRLLDLTSLGWPPVEPTADGGLRVAATCTVAQLHTFFADPPGRAAGWTVGPLVRQCCEAFLASFKVLGVATVGGNLVNALPAGPMIALAVALDGVCTVWRPDGSAYDVDAAGFVVGDNAHVLAAGEVLRSVTLPAASLTAATAFRRASLSVHGRSAALVVGRRRDTADRAVTVTVTAATRRPVRLEFGTVPDPADVTDALAAAVPDALWHDDVHGHPRWRAHLARAFAAEVCEDLARSAA
jgi:CO/xanthine dehydrogenase FAD-binding subunit